MDIYVKINKLLHRLKKKKECLGKKRKKEKKNTQTKTKRKLDAQFHGYVKQ